MMCHENWTDDHPMSSMPSFQAKQRASILWLISKACDNKIPPELREPYYKDHDGEDRLKPHIIQSLANAELYCLVLANIYMDHNYNTLSHNGIMQVLMRKGIYVTEPHDTSLTESVLLQNAPIKMVSDSECHEYWPQTPTCMTSLIFSHGMNQ